MTNVAKVLFTTRYRIHLLNRLLIGCSKIFKKMLRMGFIVRNFQLNQLKNLNYNFKKGIMKLRIVKKRKTRIKIKLGKF